MTRSGKSSRVGGGTRTFTRDELVIRLVELGVSRAKAEHEADRQTVNGVALDIRPRPAKRSAKRMSAEAIRLRAWCRAEGLPMPMVDYRFAPHRTNFELDYAWPNVDGGGGFAIEVQGGIWRKGGGAHQGKGHQRDMRKLNLAQSLGWTVLQFEPSACWSPATLEQVRASLSAPETPQ